MNVASVSKENPQVKVVEDPCSMKLNVDVPETREDIVRVLHVGESSRRKAPDISSRSNNSFVGMKPYRKLVLHEEKWNKKRDSWIPRRCENHFRKSFVSSWTGNSFFKSSFKNVKKKKRKPKQIWVPKKKCHGPETRLTSEVRRMTHEKMVERKHERKKCVPPSQLWLNYLVNVLRLFSRSSKTPMIQIIFEDNLVWSNQISDGVYQYGEKKMFSRRNYPTLKQVWVPKKSS